MKMCLSAISRTMAAISFLSFNDQMRWVTPSLCFTSISGLRVTLARMPATFPVGSEKSENIWLKLALQERSRFSRSVLGPESVVSWGFMMPES